MLCPNCSEMMKSDYYDGQYVSHCSSCGASFFEANGINRITFDTASKLSADKYRNVISPAEKLCPKDFTPFNALSNTEAIPSNLVLFECPTCGGVFAYPSDLVKFKKAQGAKIDYFKTWERPFASVHSVLVIFVILVLSAATILTFNTIQNRTSVSSEASDLFKSLTIIQSGHYRILSFRTSTPLKSQIIITNNRDGSRIFKDISKEFSKYHQLVLTDLDEKTPYSYEIVLSDKNGNKIKTGTRRLVLTR